MTTITITIDCKQVNGDTDSVSILCKISPGKGVPSIKTMMEQGIAKSIKRTVDNYMSNLIKGVIK